MADVFISYKREERAKAKALAEAIIKRGYSVWWDVDLLPGAAWSKEIEAVINKAKVAVVLWSAASVASDWVNAEATEAKRRGIIVPAIIEAVEPPMYFRGDQTLDLTGWSGDPDSSELVTLLAAIESRVGPPTQRASASPTEVSRGLAAPNLEAEFWRTVSGAGVQKVGEYEAYITRFGADSHFSDIARMRIIDLKKAAPGKWLGSTVQQVAAGVAFLAAVVTILAWINQQRLSSTKHAKESLPTSAVADFDKTQIGSTESLTTSAADVFDETPIDAAVVFDETQIGSAKSLTTSAAADLDEIPIGLLENLATANKSKPWDKITAAELVSLEGRQLLQQILPDTSIETLEAAANNGDPMAALLAGLAYNLALGGVAEDYGKAVAHYAAACDANIWRGCSSLGVMYRNGNGVPQDDAKAVAFSQEACDGGNAHGCDNLGWMYENGKGVPRDDAKAVAFYQKACDGGSWNGCVNLGVMYQDGGGVPQDDTKAVSLYQKGCDEGRSNGCNRVGGMYEKGKGVPQDDAKAVELYQKACDGGGEYGCFNLGRMYATGSGVVKNRAEAIRLYRSALSINPAFEEAKNELKRLTTLKRPPENQR